MSTYIPYGDQDALISAAAEAVEVFGDDELERFLRDSQGLNGEAPYDMKDNDHDQDTDEV